MVTHNLTKGKVYYLMIDGETSYTPVRMVKWNHVDKSATVMRGVSYNNRYTTPMYMLESKSNDAADRTLLTGYLEGCVMPGNEKSRRTNMARLKKKFPEYFV